MSEANMQTTMACLAAGIHSYQLHPFLEALVSQELPQLIERPAIRAPTFGLVPRLLVRAFTNTRQVLNRNCRIALFSFPDYRRTDGMIEPRSHPDSRFNSSRQARRERRVRLSFG